MIRKTKKYTKEFIEESVKLALSSRSMRSVAQQPVGNHSSNSEQRADSNDEMDLAKERVCK